MVVTAKLLGLRVPGRITGADLMSALIAEAWRLQLSVAIVGGAPEVNERALENLRLTDPGLDVTGWRPYGFDPDRAAEIANRLRALAPRVVFVCFGAPRSEIWVAEHRYLLPSGVLVCAGAGVAFLAGAKKRAPACPRAEPALAPLPGPGPGVRADRASRAVGSPLAPRYRDQPT